MNKCKTTPQDLELNKNRKGSGYNIIDQIQLYVQIYWPRPQPLHVFHRSRVDGRLTEIITFFLLVNFLRIFTHHSIQVLKRNRSTAKNPFFEQISCSRNSIGLTLIERLKYDQIYQRNPMKMDGHALSIENLNQI